MVIDRGAVPGLGQANFLDGRRRSNPRSVRPGVAARADDCCIRDPRIWTAHDGIPPVAHQCTSSWKESASKSVFARSLDAKVEVESETYRGQRAPRHAGTGLRSRASVDTATYMY
jgi:hypothetical protein